MKKSQIILVVVALLVVGALSWKTQKHESVNEFQDIVMFESTGIPCLPGGHANAALHIHTDLKILVDGVAEEIPANLGIKGDCMAQVHTHDNSGKIHIESEDASRTYTLTDFFKVYGKSIDRGGYEMEITVNGKKVYTPETLILEDHDEIVVKYSKVEIKEVVLPPHSPGEGEDEPIACTMEAKICPDGSAVGRSGPNCEFAPCPGE